MANITLKGNDFTNVPAVELPTTGGGTTLFTDVSDTTAAPSDVLSGKYYYTAAGVKTEGTGTQESGTDTSDATLTSGNQMLASYTAYANGTKYTGTIPTKNVNNITFDGSTVNVPTGYYPNSYQKSCRSGSVTSPDSISGTSATVSTATNEVTFTKTISVTPVVSTAGWVDEGTVNDVSVSLTANINTQGSSSLTESEGVVTAPAGYYSMNAVKSLTRASVTLPLTISGTSATVSTDTNSVTFSKTVSITPNVGLPGYISSGVANNTTLELTANITPLAATTYTPTSSNKTITSGKYITGTQTIEGIVTSNLSAANIKNGVVVKVGTSSDDDSVTSLTGTYTSDATLSNNNQMLSGYTAYSKGTKYTGNIATKTASDITIAQNNVTVPAGYYASSNTVQATTWQIDPTIHRVTTTAYTDTGASITVLATGTYRVYWSGFRSSTSGTNGSQLYVNGVSASAVQTTFSNNAQIVMLSGIALNEDDIVTIRARARSTAYSMYVCNLTIRQTS